MRYTTNVQKRLLSIIGTGVAVVALASMTSLWILHAYPSQTPQVSSARPRLHRPPFNKHVFSTTDPTSPWVIINKTHPISPSDYAPSDLTSIGNNQQMRTEAATALQHMFSDAQAAGYTLIADSGYRSYSLQTETYNSIVKAYGQTYADTVSARPGYSEHQSGWAVDIGSGDCRVADCFASTPAGTWATAYAYQYGFILRYPPTLTDVTGYHDEAWHFRYIGPLLSNQLHTEKVQTLEQFFNIPGGTTYE